MLCLADTKGQTRSRQRRPRQTSRQRPRQSKAALKNSQKVKFDLCYDFSIQAMPSRINFVTLIPKTIPDRRKILRIDYSTKPSRLFSKNGSDYAEFVFTRPSASFQLKINIEAVLFRYDLSTAEKKYDENHHPDPNADLGNFLKSEKYIEKNDPQIRRIAEGIKGKDEETVVRNIYNYVIDNMKYVPYTQEYGALYAARKKLGDCVEYSDLLVALCRAKNIPARVLKGYATEFNDTPNHAWAEVYLKNFGWVPFDPTYGDVKDKSDKSKRFRKLKPIYIWLTHTRNDPVLDKAITVQGLWIGEVTLKDSIVFR